MKHLWILLLLCSAMTTTVQAEEAAKIVSCLRTNMLPGSHVQELEIATTDIAGSTRTLKAKFFTTREKLPDSEPLLRGLLQITGPDYLAGAAYLIRQTEDRRFDSMYVYLPSVKRVRRISTDFADGSLLGTNFSYYEFKQMSNTFNGLGATAEADAEIEGRDVHVVAFNARPEEEAPIYSSVRVWVDQKTCVPLRADFYKGEQVRKRFSAPVSGLKKSGELWYLSEIEMRDLIDDTKTVLRILKMTDEKELPLRLFDPNTFYLRE